MLQTAEILFFVIDNQTRSTASLVEAAYLAGENVLLKCLSVARSPIWKVLLQCGVNAKTYLSYVCVQVVVDSWCW